MGLVFFQIQLCNQPSTSSLSSNYFWMFPNRFQWFAVCQCWHTMDLVMCKSMAGRNITSETTYQLYWWSLNFHLLIVQYSLNRVQLLQSMTWQSIQWLVRTLKYSDYFTLLTTLFFKIARHWRGKVTEKWADILCTIFYRTYPNYLLSKSTVALMSGV